MTAYNWQKSSFSGDTANCLYLAAAPDGAVKLRESDEPDTVLTTTPGRLRALLLGVKAGEFDHLAQ
ncbi:DUF397 domain-containing protein [Kitasatospora purpeofusca]|uniref:DUF397 domain-containing protein n=1 Tax=Kitasatospora purpeofusca TaxID=67352 RepID=UPI002A5A7C79|nr:DUF397 domain-containing protein [Kitasatospora purpeofusca]MDY0812608.1 DUF397 domain-containing protein [Kitasatospora purpeofusca]